MTQPRPFPSICGALLAILAIAAAPEHPAIAQYRAYVAAVRSGDEKALLKLAAPVSKDNQPVQLAHIKCMIAMEQLRKETVAQLGPIDYVKDDGWMGTGVLPDEMIKDLKASEYKGLAGIIAKNPETGQMDLTVAIMKKVNGTWRFPFGIDPYIDGEEKNGELLKEPEGDERDAMLQELNSQTKAAPVVIKRLQNKEFKNRAEVLSALTELSSAARRE